MPALNRIKSGKFYYNDFSQQELDGLWSVYPTSETQRPYTLQEKPGFLRLKHTDEHEAVRLLMKIPDTFSFVMEMKNEYMPVEESDSGGITLFQELHNKIELLEYYDGAIGETMNYTHMRLRKQGRTYEGYGSKDNGKTWNLIGAKTTNEMEFIGIVLNGVKEDRSVPLDIDYISFYQDTSLIIRNAKPGTRFEVYDGGGALISTRGTTAESEIVRLDVRNKTIPFNGYIRTIEADGTFSDTPTMQMWGGDTFWYGLYLDFYIDGTDKLDSAIEKYLGEMPDGVIEIPIEVENPCEEPMRNVYIDVIPHEWYFGHQWVEIAQDNFGQAGTYQKRIWIGDIFPAERHFFWLRIKRVSVEQEAQASRYKFKLVASN